MSPRTILRFRFDRVSDDTIAAHGLTTEQVESILDDRFVITTNRKNRRAPYVVIGRDYNGQCLAMPVEPTEDPAIWRPVTAWRCKPSEAMRWRRGR